MGKNRQNIQCFHCLEKLENNLLNVLLQQLFIMITKVLWVECNLTLK